MNPHRVAAATLAILACACSSTPSMRVASTLTFDLPAGRLPAGLLAATGEWRIAEGGVLAQLASSPPAAFNVLLVEDGELRDVDLSVRLRARKGEVDQGGGLVWRARDANNYYVVRFNPLEDNYRLYYVEDGRRVQLESAETALDPAAWHTLRVRTKGDHIECWIDDALLLDARDPTFPDAGMIGLWTKADARTEFDDLHSEFVTR